MRNKLTKNIVYFIILHYLLILTIGCSSSQTAIESPIRHGKGQYIATLQDKRIMESSGLACSRLSQDIFWTHNDSGDIAQLYAFDKKGISVGSFVIPELKAIDWEDLSSFKLGDISYLVIADTGDNDRKRNHSTLYIVEEPTHNAVEKHPEAKLVKSIHFVYEDGPKDCEAVSVDPTDGTFYLISKSFFSCKVYTISWPTENKMDVNKLQVARYVADLPLMLVTGMDITPDGRRAVVLTYTSAYQYFRNDGETWFEAFARKPLRISLPIRRQVEAICYGADGKLLYLTSEGVSSPLYNIPVN